MRSNLYSAACNELIADTSVVSSTVSWNSVDELNQHDDRMGMSILPRMICQQWFFTDTSSKLITNEGSLQNILMIE